ncbi:MAG: glycosyl hydrolase family 28-related protein, partial [Terriglobia bacterium]
MSKTTLTNQNSWRKYPGHKSSQVSGVWLPSRSFGNRLLSLGFGVCLFLSALTPAVQSQKLPFYNIQDYGAKADGKTVNTAFINQAIEACNKAGGGTVFIPVGEFRSGTIVLLSNVTLHLDAGAILKGSDDLKDYVKVKDEQFGLILARNTENIAITGRGI